MTDRRATGFFEIPKPHDPSLIAPFLEPPSEYGSDGTGLYLRCQSLVPFHQISFWNSSKPRRSLLGLLAHLAASRLFFLFFLFEVISMFGHANGE